MADRYTYLALLPFHFALASWLVQIWMTGVIRIPFRLGVLAGLGLVIVLGSLSLRQTWHWQDEESLWTRVIDVEPDNYWAWVDRGLYRLKANRPDDALPDFDRALAIDPTNAAALNGRAVIFILEGEFDKATADLDKAIHLVPRYVDAISNRGVAHFNNQAFEAARRDFQRALELDASDATLWFKMALCEIELGNDDSARAAFEQAKQRGYNTDQIRYYQKRIE